MSDEQPKRPLKIAFGAGRMADRTTPTAPVAKPTTPPTAATRIGGSDAWDVLDPTPKNDSKIVEDRDED